MFTSPELEADRIRSAHGSIDPVFTDSPQFVHEGLSARYGAPVIVKVETANPIRSFKGRGTWIALHELADGGRIDPDRAVVCVSAGNFGQGVAFAARALGFPCVVFASRRANREKIAMMPFDEARSESEAFAAAEGLHLLVDGEEPVISTGAATVALEVTDAVERVVAPTRDHVRPGRQRVAHQRRGGVDAGVYADLPGGGGAGRSCPRDDAQLASGAADRHRYRDDLLRRDRVARRASRYRAPSSSWPVVSTTCDSSPRTGYTSPRRS